MFFVYGESWLKSNKNDNIIEFNNILNSYLYFKKDTFDNLEILLKNNPKFIMGYCLKGFLLLLTRDTNKNKEIDLIIKIIEKNTFNLSEKLLQYINILREWSAGNLRVVQEILIKILINDPKDILAFRLYHFNQIFLSLNNNYLKKHLEKKKKWNEKDEYFPLVLGMTSYALEENNMYIEAELYAKESLNISSKDLWSIHAMCHLHDSKEENIEGENIFHDMKINWDLYGPMKRHLWWHKSLFYYYQKKYKECLSLYDNYIKNEDYFYLDFCNSASLLLRLKFEGIDIGNRMQILKKYADYFIYQNNLPFIDFHILLFYSHFDNSNFDYFESKEFINKYLNSDYENAYKNSLKPLIHIMKEKKIDNIDIVSNCFADLGGSFAQREVILLKLIDSNKGKKNNYTKVIKDKIINKRKFDECE